MTIRHALELAKRAESEGEVPVGAVLVLNQKVIAAGYNMREATSDPTAHAEVNAIRAATSKLQRFHLDDCVLYTTCEPCPMCLGAVYWAGIPVMYYGNTREDAARYGFSDEHIYQEIGQPLDRRQVSFNRILDVEAIEAFNLWDQKSDKIVY